MLSTHGRKFDDVYIERRDPGPPGRPETPRPRASPSPARRPPFCGGRPGVRASRPRRGARRPRGGLGDRRYVTIITVSSTKLHGAAWREGRGAPKPPREGRPPACARPWRPELSRRVTATHGTKPLRALFSQRSDRRDRQREGSRMTNVDEPVENAWLRSGGRCECRCGSHHHADRCAHKLRWESRAQESRRGAWEVRHWAPPSVTVWEATRGCEILCWECYIHLRECVRSPQSTTPQFRAGRHVDVSR